MGERAETFRLWLVGDARVLIAEADGEVSADSRSPAERVEDDDKILFEMRQAVREALGQHKRAGNPVAVWRNERVEWIPPAQEPRG